MRLRVKIKKGDRASNHGSCARGGHSLEILTEVTVLLGIPRFRTAAGGGSAGGSGARECRHRKKKHNRWPVGALQKDLADSSECGRKNQVASKM